MRPGTQGYAEQSPFLVDQYEALGFEHKHSEVLHLLPNAPSRQAHNLAASVTWTRLVYARAG